MGCRRWWSACRGMRRACCRLSRLSPSSLTCKIPCRPCLPQAHDFEADQELLQAQAGEGGASVGEQIAKFIAGKCGGRAQCCVVLRCVGLEAWRPSQPST